MQNATPAEPTPTKPESDAPSVISFTASDAPPSKPTYAIDVLRTTLDDLQLKTSLIQSLDHKLIQMTEAEIMEQIQKLTMEAVSKFLSSETPGELQKKVKSEKVRTGHGVISVTGAQS